MTKNKKQLNSSSVRGGYRENAGRKSSWNHTDTCTIRIPKPFAEQLVELARHLDNGEVIDTETKSKLLGYDLVTESIQVEADHLDSPTTMAGKGARIDTETKSKLLGYDLVTESITTRTQDPEPVTSQQDKLVTSDTVTESNLEDYDTVTESKSSTSDRSLQLACQPDIQRNLDNDTESIPPECDNVTESNLLSKHQTLTQSIPDLKEALVQAVTIVKAKKSARESIARLLSKLYSTQVSPDDLK